MDKKIEVMDPVFLQIKYLINCPCGQFNQQMTIGNRRCISIPANKLWSEPQLCTRRTDLNHITRRFEKNNVRFLELTVSFNFALMKQIVLDVISTQSKMPCSSSENNKCFSITTQLLGIVKDYWVLSTSVFWRINTFKVYELNKLEIFNFLLHNIVRWVGMFIKKRILSSFYWKVPIFCQLQLNCHFLVSDGPIKKNFSINRRIFFEKIVWSNSWQRKNVSRCTTQNSKPNSWFVPSIWKMKSPKATSVKHQNDKKLGQQNYQRSGTSLSQLRPHFFLLIVVVMDIFADMKFIFLISHLGDTLFFSKVNLGKKFDPI